MLAMENNDLELMKIIQEDMKMPNNPRLKKPLPPVLLSSMDTGT